MLYNSKQSKECWNRSKKKWLTDQNFANNFGFKKVDSTNNGYELLALSFDSTTPQFAENAKEEKIESKSLTIYYDVQCPFVYQRIDIIKTYCKQNNIDCSFVEVEALKQAKELPCVFNNWAIFYNGNFETINLIDIPTLNRIIGKEVKI